MNWRLVALILGAVGLFAVAIMLAGASPIGTVVVLLKGSFGSARALSGTLRETTPLLMLGLAVFLALRAGLFNIGAEGQFLVGALACAVVALRFPGLVGIMLGSLFGAICGAVWALPAGLIKAYRNGHEVITTIMLNNVAAFLTSMLVAGPFKGPNQQFRSTSSIAPETHIPNLSLGPVDVSYALLIGVVGAVILSRWLKRSVSGYELQAVGANPTAAKVAGVSVAQVTVRAMVVSGAISGLAGAFHVLAFEGRFYESFSPGFGFNALGVALLAGGNAYGVLPASLLFGALEKGGTVLATNGIPKGITFYILGLLILVAAAIRYRRVKVVA